MIVGIGIDAVELARFERTLARTPTLRIRLFAESERGLPVRSLAARFAAKEALVKAIGYSTGFGWQDVEIVSDDHGNPFFDVHGGLAELLVARGIDALHLSMTHDGGMAFAFVVAESTAPTT